MSDNISSTDNQITERGAAALLAMIKHQSALTTQPQPTTQSSTTTGLLRLALEVHCSVIVIDLLRIRLL